MAVETLRPNAAGDLANWPTVTGAATHQAATSDDLDTSYIRNGTAVSQEDDLNLTDSALTTQTIDSIDVRFRARSETTAVGQVQVGLRLSATNSLAANQTAIPTSATNFTKSAIARPGGGSWAVADLNALQVVAIGDNGAGTAIRLFELYVDVNYTAIAGSSAPLLTLMGVG